MAQQPIKALTIVGGGTAGWISAALLSRTLGPSVAITVVESDEIGIVGVGEATIPAIRLLNSLLGLDENDFLAATHGTIKLGIDFVDWHTVGQSYLHAFGPIGRPLGMAPFHHYWLRRRQAGHDESLWDYSLNARAAKAGRFDRIPQVGGGYLEGLAYAFHFDAALYAQYLRRYSEAQGVTRVEGRIVGVDQDAESGFVTSLTLQDGRKVGGEFFIDCSGFRGLLIEEALHTGYESWSDLLFCDRAWAVQSEGQGDPPPYTDVTAHSAGWRWRIPLQHRYGNGYVFSSRHISDEDALAELKAAVPDPLLHEPRLIRFNPGRREQVWNKNVIALGLASGFLEPLESTSIALIETGIEKIKALFPDRDFAPELADEFNDWSRREMERVRDFIILHYWANKRRDTAFWRDCNAVTLPDTLQRKIDLFLGRGHFVRYRWEMFAPPSWMAIYAGFELLPSAVDPSLDGVDPKALSAPLAEMRKAVREVVASAPPHQAFLDQYCRPAPASASSAAE